MKKKSFFVLKQLITIDSLNSFTINNPIAIEAVEAHFLSSNTCKQDYLTDN